MIAELLTRSFLTYGDLARATQAHDFGNSAIDPSGSVLKISSLDLVTSKIGWRAVRYVFND